MNISDLDKITESSLLQITFYISISILFILIGIIVSYIKVISSEQAKINIITANFKQLNDQLKENTQTTKSIEANISQKQWVNQQAWLKKHECYEEIFKALLDYVTYVHYLQSRNEYEKFVNEGPDIYVDQYSQPEEISEWARLKEKIDNEKASGATKKKEDELYTIHSLAEKKLADTIFIYAVFLDPGVGENITYAMASVSLKIDWETDEENFTRMHNDVAKAVDNIRIICKKELGL